MLKFRVTMTKEVVIVIEAHSHSEADLMAHSLSTQEIDELAQTEPWSKNIGDLAVSDRPTFTVLANRMFWSNDLKGRP